jgi:lipopolysaccharide cholinephosphotransferase
MPRPDYEKFISYCKSHKEELKPFALKHYTTCKEYIYPIARLIDTRYEIHYNTAKEYGLGLFVDIYPFDGYVPEDKKQLRKLERNTRKILTLGNNQFIKSKHWYKTLPKFFWWLIIKHQNLNKLIEKTDKLAQKHPYEQAEFVRNMNWDIIATSNVAFRKEWFEGKSTHVFVDQEFSIPSNYDEVLKQSYGDYMKLPPVNERVGHHFYSAYLKENSNNKLTGQVTERTRK